MAGSGRCGRGRWRGQAMRQWLFRASMDILYVYIHNSSDRLGKHFDEVVFVPPWLLDGTGSCSLANSRSQ